MPVFDELYSYFIDIVTDLCTFYPVYDLLTGKVVRRLTGHNNCTRDVSWHPFNSEIISTSVGKYPSGNISSLQFTSTKC